MYKVNHFNLNPMIPIQNNLNCISKFNKDNKWYRLKGKCFACSKGEDTDTWNHRKKDCCSSNGYLYINDECNVSCDECDKPSFVLHWRFNCGSHDKNKNDGYYEPEPRYLIAAISTLAKMGDIPVNIFKQMNKILLEA